MIFDLFKLPNFFKLSTEVKYRHVIRYDSVSHGGGYYDISDCNNTT